MRASASFAKYEGLGNDFIVIEVADERDVSSARARALCDRRFGIGGDGVLLLLPATNAGDVRMRVINADGSVTEMCGNGIRCAALHVARRRGLERGELRIDTDAGERRCAFERAGDEAVVVVDMGVARVMGDVSLPADGEPILLTQVDVGNPHAVALRATTPAQLERLGPSLATSSAFAHGANIEFARLDGDVLDVLVWERGAGATLACGTGACAAVAVAQSKGAIAGDGPVRVRLPGGELEIVRDRATGRVSMRGPARHVFDGTFLSAAE